MRVKGIEPLSTAWKAVILPLNHTRNYTEAYQNFYFYANWGSIPLRSRSEMDIMPAFEAVVPGSNPGGSTKWEKNYSWPQKA